MSPARATPYPWNALDSVPRQTARRAARARRQVQAVLDPTRLAAALAELTESEVSIVVRDITCTPPRRWPLSELAFELGDTGLRCVLAIESELAINALARVLRRPLTLPVLGT